MRVSVCVTVFASALWAGNAHAQDNTAFAQQRFTRGTALYDAHDYTHALDDFRASLALYSSPNARLYVARCLRELGRLDEALPEFDRAAREAADRAPTDPRYAATRDAARAEGHAIESRVGTVTVVIPGVTPTAHVQVAGREVPIAGLGVAIPVLPGDVAISVDAEGYFEDRQVIHVAAGHDTAVELHLRPRPVLAGPTIVPARTALSPHPEALPVTHPATGVPRAVAIASLGVGTVGLLGFVTFGLLANGRYSSLQTTCGMATCPASLQGDVNTGRTYQTLTNGSLAAMLVGGAAGGIFWLLGHPATTDAPVSGLRMGFTGNALTLDGAF